MWLLCPPLEDSKARMLECSTARLLNVLGCCCCCHIMTFDYCAIKRSLESCCSHICLISPCPMAMTLPPRRCCRNFLLNGSPVEMLRPHGRANHFGNSFCIQFQSQFQFRAGKFPPIKLFRLTFNSIAFTGSSFSRNCCLRLFTARSLHNLIACQSTRRLLRKVKEQVQDGRPERLVPVALRLLHFAP